MGFIYIIRNEVNEKVYIGQTTKSVQERFMQHLKLLKSNKNQLIHKAIVKYGKESFYIETLEECSNELLDEREIFYIELYDSFNKGYNLCKGGNQPKRLAIILPKEELIEMYKSGSSQREIATIAKFLQNTEMRNKNNKLKRYSKVSKDKLIEFLEQGKSQREIARLFNVNHSAIKRAIIKFCLQNKIVEN
jgi:group I intron endonuclease